MFSLLCPCYSEAESPISEDSRGLTALLASESHRPLPSDTPSYEEFQSRFSLSDSHRQQSHSLTPHLSQMMHASISKGLDSLLDVDVCILEGLHLFIPQIRSLSADLLERIKSKGRIFLVGPGSSGQIAVDLAAKCTQIFPEVKGQVIGLIAGGDSAMIRAKESIEDSEIEGGQILEETHLSSNDAVILISSNGAASFNAGCGHYSANQGAKVYYFYNNINIPAWTQELFERSSNPVIPLCIDIGPEKIVGSTHLKTATLTEAALGALLGFTLLSNRDDPSAIHYPQELVKRLRQGMGLLRRNQKWIEKLIRLEEQIFSDPQSNFKLLHDKTERGYVTFLASSNCIREVMLDTAELPCSFSIHPICKEEERDNKRAEFRAYLAGEKCNQVAWQTLLGRESRPAELADAESFILASRAEGIYSYRNRPTTEGNLVVGVAKLKEDPILEDLLTSLQQVNANGGKTAIILMCSGEMNETQNRQLTKFNGKILVIDHVPEDALGITESILLKLALKLISIGSMVLMNKVHGSRMIDVRASNDKQIAHCMQLIKEISGLRLNDRELYESIIRINIKKKEYEEKGIYTPSVVKIALAICKLNLNIDGFQHAVETLAEQKESIEWIES